MRGSIGEAVKAFYEKYNDPDRYFQNPPIIDGYGASERFPYGTQGWDSYCTIDMLFPALDAIEGSIVEIGAHEGTLTTILANWAQQVDKKVYVCDPYNGEQQGTEEAFKTFRSRMRKFKDTVYLCRAKSQSKAGKIFIESSDPCFVWVDGLHQYAPVKEDIQTSKAAFKHEGIIGVHDIRGIPEAPQMFRACQEEQDDQWTFYPGPDTAVFGFMVREA